MANQPIRVLCVFAALNRGGAESMCMNLYRHIDRTKVQFDFVKHTDKRCDYENEIEELGGLIYEAPRYMIYNYFQYRAWWTNHLKNHPEHKIIHGHFFTIASVYFRFVLANNCITIGHSHSAEFEGKDLKNALKKILTKRIEKYSTYCFACSEEAGKWLFPHKDFTVLKNAIDVEAFSFNEDSRMRIRDEFNINSDSVVVGHIGRFTTQKNHFFLIDIFDSLHKINKNSVLVLVGEGELRTAVEEKVSSLGLSDSVIFTGVRNDIPDLMSAFDVFVLPSRWEGLPVVGIEAQASGLKCIFSDCITKEVNISGTCEFLPITDVSLWAKTILNNDLTRIDVAKQIIDAGYDIKTTSEWLKDYYMLISKCV